jgi:hypothetical protein
MLDLVESKTRATIAARRRIGDPRSAIRASARRSTGFDFHPGDLAPAGRRRRERRRGNLAFGAAESRFADRPPEPNGRDPRRLRRCEDKM